MVEPTLRSIKCVEAVAACAKSPGGPSPLCLLQCWSESPDFWSRDLAGAASDDRGTGEITPRTPEEAHISGGRGARSIHGTQKHGSAASDDVIVLKLTLFRHQIKGFFNILLAEGYGVGHCYISELREDVRLAV